MNIFLVGGAVRDALLNIEVQERDWVVVGASESELIDKGYKKIGKDFPVFLHPKTKEEYALARQERKTALGHKGFEFKFDTSVTLEEDLLRRDLTINAIAEDKDGNLIDPYGGMEDIKNKLLKSVSTSFDEDPLRVLRVARFASKLKFLDFKIENNTLEQMKKISSSGEIETLSKERVWAETYKALSTSNPEEYFSILLKVGALEKICQPIDLNLNALEKTSSDNQDHTIKWSVSISENENIEKINNSFNAPKEFSEISEICSQINLFSSKEISPESLMDLVNKCDLLRKPERFYKASKASSYIIESSLKPEKWIEIYDLLSDVSVDKTLREGKLIAKKLNTDRLAAVKNYLEKL